MPCLFCYVTERRGEISRPKYGSFNELEVLNQAIKTRSLITVYPGEEFPKAASFCCRFEVLLQTALYIH